MSKNQPVTLEQLEKLLKKQKEEITNEITSDLRTEIVATGKSLSNQMKNIFAKQQKYLQTEFKNVNKRFDDQEEKFFDWKSEIFTKIDKDYAGPLNTLHQESSTLSKRSVRHEEGIERINTHLGLPPMPAL